MVEQGKVDDMGKEIEAFKSDIKRLQDDLSHMLEASGSYSKEKLHQGRERLAEGKEQLRHSMEELKHRGQAKAHQAYEYGAHAGHEALDMSRHSVETRPLTAILVAFAAGALLGNVFERRHK